MRSDLLCFMKDQKIRGTTSVGKLLAALEDEEKDELLADVQKAVEEFGLFDSQRVDTFLILLGEDDEDEDTGDAA